MTASARALGNLFAQRARFDQAANAFAMTDSAREIRSRAPAALDIERPSRSAYWLRCCRISRRTGLPAAAAAAAMSSGVTLSGCAMK